jgi:pimeloyl-ACP methyl ester carboxylesterase
MSETLPVVAESQLVLEGGRSAHLVQAGEAGQPVLFLHGYADSWRSFEPLFPLLSRHFRLFALDQRGHGDSDPADGYAIADFTADAAEVIKQLDLGPVDVVGHSLGSIVAQRLAVEHPALVRRLVLIGAAPTAAGHAGLAELLAELETAGDPIPAELIEAFQTSTAIQPLAPERLEQILAESAKLGRGAWLGTAAGLLEEPPEDGSRVVPAPSLSIWGKEDGIFDLDAQTALARIIPNLTTRHYPGVGHAPNWEIPETVAQDILAFLQAA